MYFTVYHPPDDLRACGCRLLDLAATELCDESAEMLSEAFAGDSCPHLHVSSPGRRPCFAFSAVAFTDSGAALFPFDTGPSTGFQQFVYIWSQQNNRCTTSAQSLVRTKHRHFCKLLERNVVTSFTTRQSHVPGCFQK